jgi:hypothetical protein
MRKGSAMGFEVYQKGSAPVPTTPSVTIQKRGLLSINRAAYELIGKPEGVELLWDAENRIIALRPAPLSNQNAYPVRAQGTHADRGPWLIAGTLFTQFIGLDTTAARRWSPNVEDGLLLIDISKPGATASSPRGRAAQRTVADSDESESATPELPSVSAAT